MKTLKKVIVFGATGTVGQLFVAQALEEGHSVTAFCRTLRPEIFPTHKNLHFFKGDVLDFQSVKNAIKGHEAVVVALGSGKQRKSSIRAVGTQHVIRAMQAHKVNRLICQTTLGAGSSRGNLNFFWKHIMFGWYLKGVFIDHEIQESYVQKSALDWTLVRPSAFTNGPKTGTYRYGFSAVDRDLRLKIARADVAHFLCQQLNDDRYIHQAVGISY